LLLVITCSMNHSNLLVFVKLVFLSCLWGFDIIVLGSPRNKITHLFLWHLWKYDFQHFPSINLVKPLTFKQLTLFWNFMHPFVISIYHQNGHVFLFARKPKMVEAINFRNHVSFKFDPWILTYDRNQTRHQKSFTNYNNKFDIFLFVIGKKQNA
jgi:hypothetical protein